MTPADLGLLVALVTVGLLLAGLAAWIADVMPAAPCRACGAGTAEHAGDLCSTCWHLAYLTPHQPADAGVPRRQTWR